MEGVHRTCTVLMEFQCHTHTRTVVLQQLLQCPVLVLYFLLQLCDLTVKLQTGIKTPDPYVFQNLI